jgi:hypothetical protein
LYGLTCGIPASDGNRPVAAAAGAPTDAPHLAGEKLEIVVFNIEFGVVC